MESHDSWVREFWSFPAWWIATTLLLVAEPMLENRGVRWLHETLAGPLLPIAPTVVLVAMAFAPRPRLVLHTVKRAIGIAAIPPVVLLALWLTGTELNVHGAAILSLIIDALLCEASCVTLLVIAAVRRVRGAP